MKSLIGNPVFNHPVHGKVKIVCGSGRTDCLVTVVNIYTNIEHTVTSHEAANMKVDAAHEKTVRPYGTRTRTMTGWQTSVEFENLIKGKVHSFASGPSGGRVESLYQDAIEEARDWILAREKNPRCRGIIKRTKQLHTLRAIAWNLACGQDARGFERD